MPPDIGQSTLGSYNNLSINSIDEAAFEFEMVKQPAMDYNHRQRIKKMSYASSHKSVPNIVNSKTRRGTAWSQRYETQTNRTINSGNLRKQLVYIGGIDNMNRDDVKNRLCDLFEIWGDIKPDILSEIDGIWNNNDCIYVRFPSIAKAIDGINVFDGIQPNGYTLSAKLVLEGSQMVYIDGLDRDWNEEVFKNFIDISNNYKVLYEKLMINQVEVIKLMHSYNLQVWKLYNLQLIDLMEKQKLMVNWFDGSIWLRHILVKLENITVNDIQSELSQFDPSFKHLPVEIRKVENVCIMERINMKQQQQHHLR